LKFYKSKDSSAWAVQISTTAKCKKISKWLNRYKGKSWLLCVRRGIIRWNTWLKKQEECHQCPGTIKFDCLTVLIDIIQIPLIISELNINQYKFILIILSIKSKEIKALSKDQQAHYFFIYPIRYYYAYTSKSKQDILKNP
jgi:hypothetical protein